MFNVFEKTYKVLVVMKSGAQFIVKCKDARWTKGPGGTIDAYEIKGAKGPVTINIDNIDVMMRI